MGIIEDKRPKFLEGLPHEYIIVDKKNKDPKSTQKEIEKDLVGDVVL